MLLDRLLQHRDRPRSRKELYLALGGLQHLSRMKLAPPATYCKYFEVKVLFLQS